MPLDRKSRIDSLLSKGDERTLLEVKGCTLVHDGLAKFPDAPTLRGKRHLEELINAKDDDYNAAVIFLIFCEDANCFSPHLNMDPNFSTTLKDAGKFGVHIIAYSFKNIYKKGVLEIKPYKRVYIDP